MVYPSGDPVMGWIDRPVCPHCQAPVIENPEWRELPSGWILDNFLECLNGCDIDTEPEEAKAA